MSSKSGAPPFIIRRAAKSDAEALAVLMVQEIHWGRLSQLGHGFVTLLHRHLITSEHAACYVAVENDEIVGYAVGATDVAKFYRQFLVRYGVMAVITLLPQLVKPAHLRIIYRGLTYFPEAHADDPPAEMISFAVRAQSQKTGVGRAVLNAVMGEMKSRGVKAVKFGTVEVTNEAANAYYQRLGCKLLRTVPFYKDSRVNVYSYSLED